MPIISIIIGFLVSIYPPQTFAPAQSIFNCDGEQLVATIYNNENGAFTIVKPLEEIDAGGFITLKWGELNLMLPRTFNKDETSFTDGRWWWSYEDTEHPQLRLRKGSGKIKDFSCSVTSNQGSQAR